MDKVYRVLVADDSTIMRRTLIKILNDHGFEVCAEAKSGLEVLPFYSKTKPDLVTMDINMPFMDGIEALKTLKQEFPDCKVIIISSLGQEHLVYEAVKSGASNFLLKPINSSRLIQTVREVLGLTDWTE